MAAIDDLRTVVSAMVSHAQGLKAQRDQAQAQLAVEQAAHDATKATAAGMDAQLQELSAQLQTVMSA